MIPPIQALGMADHGLLPEAKPLSRAWRLGLAILAGVMLALGTAPYDLLIVALPGLGLACWLFTISVGVRAAVMTGWAVGLGYFGFALGWIIEPFLVDAALTGWMAPFALIGLGGGLAIFWALAFGLAAAFVRCRGAALIIGWTAAELARAYVFTGFPWALLSYIWLDTPVIQWVSVIGPHGLVAATAALGISIGALIAIVLDRLFKRPARDHALGLYGLPIMGAALVLGGLYLTPEADDLEGRPTVRLIQPNAPQHQKWDPEHIPTFFDRQMRFTAAPSSASIPPALIVWPETALPVSLHRADGALALIADAANGTPVALGIQREHDGKWHNSMIVLDGSGRVGQIYDKHHLVPFGEYMPFASMFRLIEAGGLAARAQGGFSPGPGPRLVDFGPELGSALPLICYEAVFPQDVTSAPERPAFLLQLTNDAWFGKWSGPYQHLAQARIRAIEMGLPMLRAANTGVSAVIDRGGRVLEALAMGEAGYLDAPLPPPGAATLYSQTGDIPVLWSLLAASLGLLAFRVRLSD